MLNQRDPASSPARAIHWSRSRAAAPLLTAARAASRPAAKASSKLAGAGDAVARGERAGGVGQDGVEDRAGLACDDGTDNLRVVAGVPAGQVAGPRAAEPEPGGVEGSLADAFPAGGPEVGGVGGGDLVDPVVAAHDECGGSALGEHGGQDRGEGEAGAADQGGAGAGWVGQRGQVVDRGRDAEGTADGGCVAEAAMVVGGEGEADSDLVDAPGDLGGGEVERDAEGFEDVGGPALA